MAEIQAVRPFLAPLSAAHPFLPHVRKGYEIRSVDLCGTTIATTQATLDDMGDIPLRNRFDMWSGAVHGVSDEHFRRLVDFYRRQRHTAAGAQLPLACVVLRGANATEQRFLDKTARMYGVIEGGAAAKGNAITQALQQSLSRLCRASGEPDDCFCGSVSPSGVRYQIVEEGTGLMPLRHQVVTYDCTYWRDKFNGSQKVHEARRYEYPMSSVRAEWFREALMAMRVGETRRVITPFKMYVELRLISIM
mmetsp:Transcript_32842/g.94781  ORF Transcript_32842/g.94781 Transcript_32842/m.94781 type:complete len:249 (-) Transcript_32842:118-864(-)